MGLVLVFKSSFADDTKLLFFLPEWQNVISPLVDDLINYHECYKLIFIKVNLCSVVFFYSFFISLFLNKLAKFQ